MDYMALKAQNKALSSTFALLMWEKAAFHGAMVLDDL